jgi:M3 family oligoendopeptidase
MVAIAQDMYRELSPETGEFFDFMVKYDLFDLESKQGKRPGGYCTGIANEKAPFIFSNFNGTSADVDVLTHEAGHAFAFYTASRCHLLAESWFSTSEVAEIHSMTMEHFTYPWMGKFFGDGLDKYLYSHLCGALGVIPYLVSVDEFQHRVFENPGMSADARRAVWKSIEEKYMPWRDYDGQPYMESGGFWMQKQHIFMFPFYYIDYALAQMCAFEFYLRMLDDRSVAWQDYLKLCKAGGSLPYTDLLAVARLSSPFAQGTVEKVVDGIMAEIQKNPFSKQV